MGATKEIFIESQPESAGILMELEQIQSNNTEVTIKLEALLTMDKASISEAISDKIEQVDEGFIDALDVFVYAKKLEYFTKTLLDNIKDKVVIPEKDYAKFGVELSERMAGVKYDFSECGDAKHNALTEQLNNLKEEIKERENFLKGVKTKMTLVDDVTGEVSEINPPVKSGKMTPVAVIK